MTHALNNHYMDIACQAREQSTCEKLKVGAVLVINGKPAALGFNTTLPGFPLCGLEEGHLLPCGRSRHIHAEIHAITTAAKNGISIDGAAIYITSSPCWDCFKAIVAAGIKKIYFRDFHDDTSFLDAAKQAGIEVEQLGEWFTKTQSGPIHKHKTNGKLNELVLETAYKVKRMALE